MKNIWVSITLIERISRIKVTKEGIVECRQIHKPFKTSDEGRTKKFAIRPRSCSSQNPNSFHPMKAEEKQSNAQNFYSTPSQNNITNSSQHRDQQNEQSQPLHKLKRQIVIKNVRQFQQNSHHKSPDQQESAHPRLKHLREKVNSIVSNSSNLSNSFSKQSQHKDELSQDSVLSYSNSNRSRKASSNSSDSGNDHSFNQHQSPHSAFSKQMQKSPSASKSRPLPKRYSIQGLNLCIVESNSQVEQKNSTQKRNSIKSANIKQAKPFDYYFGYGNDQVIDDFTNSPTDSLMTQTTNRSSQHVNRTRAQSHSIPSKFSSGIARPKSKTNTNKSHEYIQANSRNEILQNYLFKCYDEFDQKKFGTVLNQDSPLDYQYLQDFIHINEQFIEDNLQFSIASLEKMHTNNCKVSIDCLMKIKIAQKDSIKIQSYVRELERQYNQNLRKINAVERNKMVNINLHYGQVQLHADDFVKSPLDLVIIIDYKNEFKQELIQSINLIISLSSHHCRICLIFPDHKTGKCVRTNLLASTPQNKSILEELLSTHLFDTENDSDEDEDNSQKMNIGFHQSAFKNALLTLSERKYTNFQSALFWLSDGVQPPIFESIQDCFLEFSLENNPEHRPIDTNLSFYVFHFGHKKQIDDSLVRISRIKNGKYFYVMNINDLCLIINQAIQDLQGNVCFSVMASIDLAEYSQIHLKEAIKESLPETRQRETSIMKGIHPKMQQTFNSLYSEQDEPVCSQNNHHIYHSNNSNEQRDAKKAKNEINLKEKIVQCQQRGQKLFSSEITKLYGGSEVWNQENDSSCSIRFSHMRSGIEKNFVFQIILKPTALLASSDIAEFIIANGTCLLLPSPNKVIYLGNKMKPVQHLKKFATCSTEIHFHLNNNLTYDISTLNYHKSSLHISYNQINLEKNQTSGQDIIKHISIQSMIEAIEEKVNRFSEKNQSPQEITQQIQQILCKNMFNCFDSFYYEIESFLSYIKEFGFDHRAICYLKCILQNYKFQSRVLFSQHLTSPLKLSNQTKLNYPKLVQIK